MSEANAGYWIMRTFMNLGVLGGIKIKILERIGHLVRMDRGRAVKEIIESKLEGRKYWEDLDSDGCRMLERICGKQRLKMAAEGSGQSRMGVCN